MSGVVYCVKDVVMSVMTSSFYFMHNHKWAFEICLLGAIFGQHT